MLQHTLQRHQRDNHLVSPRRRKYSQSVWGASHTSACGAWFVADIPRVQIVDRPSSYPKSRRAAKAESAGEAAGLELRRVRADPHRQGAWQRRALPAVCRSIAQRGWRDSRDTRPLRD